MGTINMFQITLEIWGCIICIAIAIISGTTVYQNGGTIKKAWYMLLVVCLLLTSDAMAFVFMGDKTMFGMLITRISNYIFFITEGLLTGLFVYTIDSLTAKESQHSSILIRCAYLCVIMQLIGAVLSPFTKWYYQFDSMNRYVRGDAIALSFVSLGFALLLSDIEAFKWKKHIPSEIYNGFILCIVLFVFCVGLHLIIGESSLINIGATVSVIYLFISVLRDTQERNSEEEIRQLESIIEELKSSKKEGD